MSFKKILVIWQP